MAKRSKEQNQWYLIIVVAILIIFGVWYFDTYVKTTEYRTAARTGTPSGAHYNLNIIGVSNPKTADMTSGSGHRIFVPLKGTCKINLTQGDFQVLDANCTDGNGAVFQLPNPDPDNDGITEYSVWARALGKPGGSSTTTPCAYDTEGVLYCSVKQMVLVRSSGRSRFENVSAVLLYVYVDLDGDGRIERYNLFSDALQDYFWNYDNRGLKLAQLRFYDVSTNVNQ